MSWEGLGLRVGENAGGKVSPFGRGDETDPLTGPVGVSSARRVERSTFSRKLMVASRVVRQ